MELLKTFLFIAGFFAIIMKFFLSLTLFLAKYSKWNAIKSPILVFLYCNPFTPIFWNFDKMQEKAINKFVILFYSSFTLLILLFIIT